MSRRRDEIGQTSLLIIGLAVVLAMAVAVVVDASAAYLQRQGLDTLADGAALAGADGVRGEYVYADGLDDLARIDPATARGFVNDYFRQIGAYDKYPGLSYDVRISEDSVVVSIRAPLDLPLTVPGSDETARIGAEGAAVVLVSE